MPLLKLIDGVAIKYSIMQLRSDHPNVSFPKVVPEEILNSYDVYSYTAAHQPHDALTQISAEDGFLQEDGRWVLNHVPSNLPLNVASENVRNERNKRLLDTDWMMLLDRIPTDMQIEYRQALRDITNQIGFPYNVEWPVYDRASDSAAQD